ncbi:hypothetical protein ACJBU6_08674 [Exserohilum turcicum]
MAAIMFRDFSFAPVLRPAYALYEAERAAMNVSPTSKALPPVYDALRPPTPPCTMGDLALQLNQQSLRINTALAAYPARPPTPESDHEQGPSHRTHQGRPTYSRIATSVLRMQRQHNSRMQCTSSHARDIAKLVKMIEHEQQCTVSDPSPATKSPASPSPSPAPSSSSSPPAPPSARARARPSGHDEGVDMDYDMPSKAIDAMVATPAWRAADRRDSCARVTKSVRMRKRSRENALSKRLSS